MTATATITVETRKGALLVPNAALRFTPPGSALPEAATNSAAGGEAGTGLVWVVRDGKPAAIVMKKGLSDGRSVEVLGGAVVPGLAVLVDILTNTK